MADFGKLNFSVAFNPTSAFPIDARTIFTSYEEAVKAAQEADDVGSTNTVYYYGMELTVIDDTNKTVKRYSIEFDKTLKEIKPPKVEIKNGVWWIDGVNTEIKAQGETGPQGPQGEQGEKGEDGFSPIVTITEIPDGNRVTITDKTGAHEFDVLNGNGGGVGTFEVIIEVEELPTENIDNNKIYIVNKSSKTEVYFHYGTGYVTLSQLIYENFKVSPTITYYVVDILPSNPLTSDLATFSSIYCYIYNNIPYVYGNAGQGDNWIKVSDLVSLNSQTQIVDNGRTYNIGQESIAGIYAYYEDKKFYLYSNNKWVEINKNNYILMLNGTNGTLTDEQYQNLVDKFPNVTLIVKQSLGEAGEGYCTVPVIAKNNLADGVIVYAASYTNGTIQSSLMIWADKTWAIEEEDFARNFFSLNKKQSVYGETEFYATQTFYGDVIFGNDTSLIGKGLSISFSQSTISSEFDLDITASGYLSLYSSGGLSIYSDDEVNISGASTSMQTVDGLNSIAINEFGRIDITSIEGVYVSAQDKFQVNAKSMSFTNLGGTATVNIAEDGTVTVAGGKAVHIISGTGTNSSSVSFTKDGIDIIDGTLKVNGSDVATTEYAGSIETLANNYTDNVAKTVFNNAVDVAILGASEYTDSKVSSLTEYTTLISGQYFKTATGTSNIVANIGNGWANKYNFLLIHGYMNNAQYTAILANTCNRASITFQNPYSTSFSLYVSSIVISTNGDVNFAVCREQSISSYIEKINSAGWYISKIIGVKVK